MSQPSFGKVKRSAVKKATLDARGDSEELKRIKNLVKEQKHNKAFDVFVSTWNLLGEDRFIYVVAPRSGNEAYALRSFEGACECATGLLKKKNA